VSDSAPKPGEDNILIAGPSKTGTTGLYTSIKQGLQRAGITARCVFEPATAAPMDNLFRLDPSTPVLVKSTLDHLKRTVPDAKVYERRVMTVRDPRDVIVSSLLFRPLTVASLRRTTDSDVEQFIAALEAKQADPSSMSVRELYEIADRVNIGSAPFKRQRTIYGQQVELAVSLGVHTVHYEDFVRGDLTDLSSYLGFDVENVSARESSMFGHIARSHASGEFVQWFLPADLEFFNEHFHDALVAFDYPIDVELPAEQRIDPANGSEYVAKRVGERRATLAGVAHKRSFTWTPEHVDSMEALDEQRDFASNGDAVACLRVAQVILNGHLGEAAGDDAAALHWARSGAVLGHRPAMVLTVELLDRLAGDDAEAHRELRRWRGELRLRSAKASREDKARIAALERELDKVSKSTEMRVGKQLVKAGRSPWRNGLKVLREIFAMWRKQRNQGRRRRKVT
jgi:hypothetical protein